MYVMGPMGFMYVMGPMGNTGALCAQPTACVSMQTIYKMRMHTSDADVYVHGLAECHHVSPTQRHAD